MNVLGTVGDSTVLIGFSEAIFAMLSKDLYYYITVNVFGMSDSSYDYILTSSPDQQTLNVTLNWFSTVSSGTSLFIQYQLSVMSEINATLQNYGFYPSNLNVSVDLLEYNSTETFFAQLVAKIMNIGGPVVSVLYLLSLSESHEGSLMLEASSSLEIILLNRALSMGFPDDMKMLFQSANAPPIPFFLPLTLEIFGLDPLSFPNLLPAASSLSVYFANSNFIDNTARDIFSLLIILLIYFLSYLTSTILKNKRPSVSTLFKRIHTFLDWNLTPVVGLSASLRISFFAFLNFTFPSLNEGFGVVSLIFSSIILGCLIIVMAAMADYVNRKKGRRRASGRIRKKIQKRGKLNVLYEEFFESKHIRKFYLPAYLLRNMLLGAAFSSLWSYPLIQAVGSVMIHSGFLMFVLVVRPWDSIIKLVAHVCFDIGVIMASVLVLILLILREQNLWTFEGSLFIGDIFVMVNLVLVSMNFVLSFELIVRAGWKLYKELQPRTVPIAHFESAPGKMHRRELTIEASIEPKFKLPQTYGVNDSILIEEETINQSYAINQGIHNDSLIVSPHSNASGGSRYDCR